MEEFSDAPTTAIGSWPGHGFRHRHPALAVGKIAYWLSGTVFRRLTPRTKTNLDDILLDMVEEPIVFVMTAAGVWHGLRSLELPESSSSPPPWMVTRVLDATPPSRT